MGSFLLMIKTPECQRLSFYFRHYLDTPRKAVRILPNNGSRIIRDDIQIANQPANFQTMNADFFEIVVKKVKYYFHID